MYIGTVRRKTRIFTGQEIEETMRKPKPPPVDPDDPLVRKLEKRFERDEKARERK